jgi:hypothetical protein
MSLYDNLQQFERRKALDAAQGRATESGTLAYSAESERSLASLPIITTYRVPLQGANGRFLFKVNDDGTRTAGSFYIDSFGRFISY